jgi:hypothetical protein
MMLVMVVSACTSPAKFTPASGSEKFPPYKGDVRVLENLPSSDQFRRVGVVVAEGVQLTSDADMVAAVKKEAAANGADAVVMQAPIKETTDSGGGVHRTLAAWAIRLNR